MAYLIQFHYTLTIIVKEPIIDNNKKKYNILDASLNQLLILHYDSYINYIYNSYRPSPRDLRDLETRRPEAVAYRAQRGRYFGPEGL